MGLNASRTKGLRQRRRLAGLDYQRGMNLVATGGLTPGKCAYDALEPADRGGREYVENRRQPASSRSERCNVARMYIGAGEDHNDPATSASGACVTEPASPRVSVIIPCYNHGHFLAGAIESAARQTLADLEIIVIDDGSTDMTPAVVEGLTDPRIRSRRTANGGVSAARNAGLDMARGEFIAFLDADDTWAPAKLERQVALMDAEPEVTLVFTDLRRYSADGSVGERQFTFVPELAAMATRPASGGGGRVIVGDAFDELGPLVQLPAWIQTNLFRARPVGQLRFSTALRLAEDLHYIMRAYPLGKAAYIADPLVDVRRHEHNSYDGHGDMLVPVIEALELLAAEPFDSRHLPALRVRTGRAWLELAHHQFWHGQAVHAAWAYARAALYPGLRRNALLHLAAVPALPVLRRVGMPLATRTAAFPGPPLRDY